MRITLEEGICGTYVIQAETNESLLIQLDWDFPGLAATFGWRPCFCGGTGGTIDCPHRSAASMLISARQYLDQTIGESADDPGYLQVRVVDD